MTKVKVAILRNESGNDHALWVKACKRYTNQIEYHVVNLTADSWLDEIQRYKFDILLAKPGGITSPFKQLYDERIYILEKVLGYKIYPSANEIFIYENKRFLSYWLKANNITHPDTHIFYKQKEALDFINNYSFPIVAKTNIGASGSGIRVLHSKKDAIVYINDTFSDKGSPKRTGPNFSKGNILKRGLHYIISPCDIKKKLTLYKSIKKDAQKGFVIFQEYILHDFEWRVVRIGDSFFAHKKLKIGEKASGSLLKSYENPPSELLDFVKKITDKYQFYSQAIDIFESENTYLVNEMQCVFGQSDPYQMLVNGVPGRYRYLNDRWKFEEGDFAANECYDLRIQYIIDKITDNIQL